MDRNQRDAQWLGDEEAHLGPAARAALGILMESNDWLWWDDPSKAYASLELAVPSHGLAKWGGDSSVMDADQWVDPLRAVVLGQAFNALYRHGRPKIKMARSVWGWPGGADTVGAAALELSQLVGPGGVFPEWKRNAKPRFPLAQRSQEERRVVTSPTLPLDKLSGRTLEYIEWAPDSKVVDIVIADSVEALRTITAAQIVILYGPDIRATLVHVSNFRDDLCALCAIHVETDKSKIADWLQPLISAWAIPGQSFATAIETAIAQSGIHAQVLSSTQSFLLAKSSFFRQPNKVGRGVADVGPAPALEDRRLVQFEASSQDLASVKRADNKVLEQSTSAEAVHSFLTEAGEKSDVVASEFTRQTIPKELSPVPNVKRSIVVRPAPPVARVLNARTRQGEQEIREWPMAGVVHIDIDVRLKTPLRDSLPSFPDDRIEWDDSSKILQIHLFELGHEPVTQVLTLPRTGNSSVATFTRNTGTDSIDLRFLISDGAQILQTARLQSKPGEPILFYIENIVTPVHRAKAAFDVALLVNDSLGNEPSVTVITGDGRAVFSPMSEHGTEQARIGLLEVLEQAVANPNASLEPLLLKLANRGSLLLKHLRVFVPDWPGTVDRVQLVTQSDAFFPIEYLYDGVLPESSTALLCSESAGCLNEGKAIPGCGIREAGERLCPMGFLGVSGLVERHTWQKGQAARMWGTPGGNKPKRHRIEDLSTIAFGASNKADAFKVDDVVNQEIVRIASIETSLGVDRISDWPAWKANLSAHSPSLLVLLVHLHDGAVYLGADAGLNLASINEKHVGNAPVVIAIGCSSGLGEIPGSSLPAILQRNGARVVVAAMTSVLGRHANRVARDLAMCLHEAAKSSSPVYIGQIITKLRCQLLAEGLALGLAVVAFGDADIVLGQA